MLLEQQGSSTNNNAKLMAVVRSNKPNRNVEFYHYDNFASSAEKEVINRLRNEVKKTLSELNSTEKKSEESKRQIALRLG